MTLQRTAGLYSFVTLCQALLVTLLFWADLILALVVVEKTGVPWSSYIVFCTVLLFGLSLEALSNKRPSLATVHGDPVQLHRLSARQTLVSVGMLLLYIVATKDAVFSRAFAACFIPSFYILLFATNQYLPQILGQWVFGQKRFERLLLVGRASNAEMLLPWLERKSNVGFRPIGI